jgi:hypothetical protein
MKTECGESAFFERDPMKPRYWVALALLGLLGACTYRFLGGLRTDVYHGQVIDAERGTPISEAVVTVVWYRAGIAIESHPLSLLDAQETVTDNDGRFSLRVSPGLDWNPLSTRVDEPAIVIYKPGYEPLWAATAVDKGFQTNDDLVSAMKAGTTIKLRTLEAAKLSNTRYASPGEVLPGGSIPAERIPNLMRAINLQSKMAGIGLYPEPTQKGTVP